MSRFVSLVLTLLLFVDTGGRVAQAASGGIDAARARGTLIVGLSFPLPAYVAGAKSRTAESPESILAEDLAARLHLRSSAAKVEPAAAAQWLASGRADVVLVRADNTAAVAAGMVLVPSGYGAGAMAIMRSDTDIKSWEQLKGRSVCLSEGGAYVGRLAARYGAIEKVQRAPADSLLALRTGVCDAAVHDDAMLNALLTLPEWKKFSARLPVQDPQQLMLAVRADDAAMLAAVRQAGADWRRNDFWPALKKKWVNNVAFEVYLDQNVPDCH